MENQTPFQPPWPEFPEYHPIPKIFYSLEHDGPFAKCLVCERGLLDPDTRYMIERIFRGSEPIVEYALCEPCQGNMAGELSQDSMQSIMEIFATVDIEARLKKLANHIGDSDEDPVSEVTPWKVDPWLDECYLTGRPRYDCRGYQIMGRFMGDKLEVQILPLLLSEDGIDMVVSRLSKQTKERLDDFMDNFTMPPEFAADPDFTPIFL